MTLFSVNCTCAESEVLLGLSDIRRIENTDTGIRVHYTCTCGHRGIWVTGKGA